MLFHHSVRPGGAHGNGSHVQGGGGNLPGVVGFGFDAEDCGVDVLELLGEWDDRSETTSAGLKARVQSGASW